MTNGKNGYYVLILDFEECDITRVSKGNKKFA